MNEVVLTTHAAQRVRDLKRTDEKAAKDVLDAMRGLGDIDVGKATDDRLRSTTRGGWRILYTVDSDKPDHPVYVIGLISASEPEGSPEEVKEVMVSAAGA